MTASDQATAPEKRLAQDVAPEPDWQKFLGKDGDPAGAALAMARHHAARAQAFVLPTFDGETWSIQHLINEYQLAVLWGRLAAADPGKANAWAIEIGQALFSPHVIGPNIWSMLDGLGIDPDTIRAYEPERATGPTTIVYEIDCPHCDDDSTAITRTLALGQPEDDGAIHIDVGMSVAQSTFECTACGCAVYTGDVEASTEDDECPNEDSDDEDDQDDDEDEEATR
ncbi:MAG TPA: hypothetical protein VFM55_19245 [Micromonosporaceae bacterium]|nr:hypothetical protein [Micromonosporaceae bacterium]